MSYEPTNWKDGDLVTSAKLNKIEQGIAAGGGVLIVHYENQTLDKTWQEIHDADACIIIVSNNSDKIFDLVVRVSASENFTILTSSRTTFSASSSDDYPIQQLSTVDDSSFNGEVIGGGTSV